MATSRTPAASAPPAGAPAVHPPVSFAGLLCPEPSGALLYESPDAPACFRDLHLDQIVAGIIASYGDHDLAPLFHVAPTDLDTITYRQEVMRDFGRERVHETITAFAQGMRTVRQHLALASRSSYRYERERWHLAAAEAYGQAVEALAERLSALPIASRGLRAFRAWLGHYADSAPFRMLAADTRAAVGALAGVRYAVRLRDASVTVLRDPDGPDYAAEVERTFEKFRRGPVRDYRLAIPDEGRLDHVEAQILERVAWLHPAPFAVLDAFARRHASFVNALLARTDRELHFYLAYLAYIAPLRRAGLPFALPELSTVSKAMHVRDAFDLALAAKLVLEHRAIVPNDVELRGAERLLVVSGPNQGGKTTFARMIGQLHYLARLGCPVPGREARLFVTHPVLVHFERVEAIETLRGKLQDDLVRIRQLLEAATPTSLVILNELFAATTLEDALALSRKVLAALSRLDCLVVCVTFLDDLAAFDEKTVSVVGAVDPADPAVRTFRFERRPASGLAYAHALAEKHRVTADWLGRRLAARSAEQPRAGSSPVRSTAPREGAGGREEES